MKKYYHEVGNRVRMVRSMRGYSREKLANIANISPKHLYEIEIGKKGFSVEVLYRLCDVLEINADYIVSGKRKMEFDKKTMDLLVPENENPKVELNELLKEIDELLKANYKRENKK